MSHIYSDQVLAALLQEGIDRKDLLKLECIAESQQLAIERMQYAHTALNDSMTCVERVRDFTSDPSHILGSPATKHGEIAEHIEVEIRNARSIMAHLKPTATFEGVGRTAPEDYIIDGMRVQSKFISGANKGLEHVLGHMRGYPGFTENGYYHIPKDQYELVTRVLRGDNVEGLSLRTIEKCKSIVVEIERESGKTFTEVVRPGISTYGEVQLGKVDSTLDHYERELRAAHRSEVREVREEYKRQTTEAQQITAPSWGEAFRYSAISAGIQGGVSAGIKVYAKVKGGKKIADFSLEDWKEVGYDFSKNACKGAISGLGIYGLTKLGDFSAPFAGALVSTAMGVASLAMDYRKGRISRSEYCDCVCALSVEAGLAAIGASIGQAVIPVPVLGAIIGSAVTKAGLELTKYIFGRSEEKLIRHMQAEYDTFVAHLSAGVKKVIADMEAYYNRLDGYIAAAFSKNSVVRLRNSVELCAYLNVPESEVITSTSDLDRYMLS